MKQMHWATTSKFISKHQHFDVTSKLKAKSKFDVTWKFDSTSESCVEPV